MDTYHIYQQEYQNYLLESKRGDKHGFLVEALLEGTLNGDILEKKLKPLRKRNGTADFQLVEVIRVLYFPKVDQEVKDMINEVLIDFPFWLSKWNDGDSDLVYWSENHMICHISSSYLYCQYQGGVCDEEDLLFHYLETKLKFGFYEALSPVYLPITLSALLNLVEFSQDDQIQRMSHELVDKIFTDLCYFSLPRNGSLLSCAGRTYPSYRHSPLKKNIHQAMRLLIRSENVSTLPKASRLGDFMASGTRYSPQYIPPDATNPTLPQCIENMTMSHSLRGEDGALDVHYSERFYPFLMSAGLYLHPAALEKILGVLSSTNLWNHSHFRILKVASYIFCCLPFFFPWVLNCLLMPFNNITCGSSLTDITASVYRTKSVVLSSFQNYNAGQTGFQQTPWMVNISSFRL